MFPFSDQQDYTPEEEEKIAEAWRNAPPLTDEDVEKFCMHPLVVKEITPEVLETEEMQALQSIIYDDTPENVARTMKRRGDEFLQNKHLNKRYTTDARSCYEEGIEQAPPDPELMHLLRLGILRCNLLLSNFGRVANQTRKLMGTIVKLSKPETKRLQLLHYLAEGLFGLGDYKSAVETCKELMKGLPEGDQKVEEVRGLMKKAMEAALKEQKIEERIAAVKALDKVGQQKVVEELKRLGIAMGPQAQEIPEAYSCAIKQDQEGFLHFPLLLIYPEYKTTDYVTDVHELDLVRNQLKLILAERPSWDTEKRYNWDQVEVYYERQSVSPFAEFRPALRGRGKVIGYKKYAKLDARVTMVEALRAPELVVAQLPVLYVVGGGAFASKFTEEEL